MSGENLCLAAELGLERGSSPRERGKQPLMACANAQTGLIPA